MSLLSWQRPLTCCSENVSLRARVRCIGHRLPRGASSATVACCALSSARPVAAFVESMGSGNFALVLFLYGSPSSGCATMTRGLITENGKRTYGFPGVLRWCSWGEYTFGRQACNGWERRQRRRFLLRPYLSVQAWLVVSLLDVPRLWIENIALSARSTAPSKTFTLAIGYPWLQKLRKIFDYS